MIGVIKRVPLRDVWRHEAHDFTGWLAENIDVLNDVLDLGLDNAERERAAGSFSVDLIAEDRSGNTVVIENQLERSDHDHLGKVITYLTAFEAKTAIWIVAEPRPEHTRAVAWLNEASDASFYLLKAEAIRIGDSAPAPLFTVIVGPSDEAREVGQVKRELAERHHERHAFWQQLLEHARTKTRLHATTSPSFDSWISASAGIAGLTLTYRVRQHDARVELYIDRGKEADGENLRIFDNFESNKATIEAAFGQPLEWQRLEGRRACRIAHWITFGGYRDPDAVPRLIPAMVDAMNSLEKALRPHITTLRM